MNRSKPFTNLRADWIAVIEAIHWDTKDDVAWTDGVLEATQRVFPRSGMVGTYTLEYAEDLGQIQLDAIRPHRWTEPGRQLERAANAMGPVAWAPMHFGAPVRTQSEALARSPRRVGAEVEDLKARVGYEDMVAIVAHPMPGRVFVVQAISDQTIALSRAEREVLSRLAFHFESGVRLRKLPGAMRATISSRGKVTRVGDDALREDRLSSSAHDIGRARSRHGRDGDATALWSALVDGSVSVSPRSDGYVVIDNAPTSRAMRAFTPQEGAVVDLAIRGTTTKAMGYALGMSPAAVSRHLSRATHKLGLLSHADLVRLATLLVDVPRSGLTDAALTQAEVEVLSLLERGLSNQAIARLRMRSVRTIANQVAALLRKTNSGSRRELAVRAAQRRREG